MKKIQLASLFLFVFFLFLLVIGPPGLAPSAQAGTTEQLIQLQTTVQILNDNVARMQESLDKRTDLIKDLETQQIDNLNKTGIVVQNLQKALTVQTEDVSPKVNQITEQVQSLQAAAEDLKSRLAKVSKQLDDIHASQQSVPRPAAGPSPAPPHN